MFTQYLAQQMETDIHFEISLDFDDFHDRLHLADIVYANPHDTWKLIDEHQFVPIAQPAGVYDETVFVANPEIESPSVQSIQGQPIAGIPNMLATKLALHILEREAVEPQTIIDHSSWLGIVGSVWRNDVSYGIVYKDTYDELSEQGKSMVHAFYTSDEKIAFHSMLVGRNALARKDDMSQIVYNMDTNNRGLEILHELGVAQWSEINQEQLNKMKSFLDT